MIRVTLICKECGHTARRNLPRVASCRGIHETPGPHGVLCPKGHGEMVRKDGVIWGKNRGALLWKER